MRFAIDHDYHIHSQLSRCSKDPEQLPERMLQYAAENGLRHIILTDHAWDHSLDGWPPFYEQQPIEHIRQWLPLPQQEGIQFGFGIETDMNMRGVIGIAPEHYDLFDFIIVPLNHYHLYAENQPLTTQERAALLVQRYDALLQSTLPLHRVGLAHMTDSLIDNRERENHLHVYDAISDSDYLRLFTETAKKGMGVELNFSVSSYNEEELQRILRPYRLAKQCGCKFYLGSDAHHPQSFARALLNFEKVVDLLELTEDDRFVPSQK